MWLPNWMITRFMFLSVIKIYSHFLFVLSGAKEDRVVENIESDGATLKILNTMQKSKVRRE